MLLVDVVRGNLQRSRLGPEGLEAKFAIEMAGGFLARRHGKENLLKGRIVFRFFQNSADQCVSHALPRWDAVT